MGQRGVLDYLEAQRDLYKHIHDQTLRLMNKGWRPAEIAEAIDLPPGLAERWSVRGYYGTVSHNVKAVYQRYLSWYDGNPCNLHPLPPQQAATKRSTTWAAPRGAGEGARGLRPGRIPLGRAGDERGRLRRAENRDARELGADALEQMGYQAESATWRNAYLYGAQELRHGVCQLPPRPMLSPDMLAALTTDTLFDFIAVRLDPQRVAGRSFTINWNFEDSGERLAQNRATAR